MKYRYLGVYETLPTKCKKNDVCTVAIILGGGKTIYKSYICHKKNHWQKLDDITGEE